MCFDTPNLKKYMSWGANVDASHVLELCPEIIQLWGNVHTATVKVLGSDIHKYVIKRLVLAFQMVLCCVVLCRVVLCCVV